MKITGFRTRAWLRGKGRLSAVAAAAAAVGLSVLGTAGTAQAATTPVWQLVYRGHAAGLDDVTAISKTNAWAVGTTNGGTSSQRPQLMHWDGHAWGVVNVSNITKFDPTSVKATAPNNVWAFGYNDGVIADNQYALIYHGSNEWSSLKLPDGFQPGMDAVLSPTNVWGVTNQGCETGPTSQRCTVLVHWNGSSWSTVTVAGEVTSVTAVGGHVFFLALTNMKFSASLGIGTPVIYEPTTKMYSFAGPNLQLTDQGPSLVVELDGHRYIAGRLTTGGHAQRFYYWNGTTWTTMSVPGNVCPPGFVGYCPLVLNSGITYDGGHGFWSGWSAHWTGTQWVNADYFATSLLTNTSINFQAVAPIPGTTDVWGAGAISAGNGGSSNTLVAVYPSLP